MNLTLATWVCAALLASSADVAPPRSERASHESTSQSSPVAEAKLAEAITLEPEPAEVGDSQPEIAQPSGAEPLVAEEDPQIEAAAEGIEIPPGRPEWIGKPASLQGKVHTIAVASGPFATDKASRAALDKALVKATQQYINEQVGNERAAQLLRYDARTIKKRFVKPDHAYHDVARYSVGWMHENFALLEFGPDFRNEVNRRWTKVKANSRVAQVVLIAGGALSLVGSLFGFFRLDNATRGYYTRRLQLVTATGILALLGVGLALARQMVWL